MLKIVDASGEVVGIIDDEGKTILSDSAKEKLDKKKKQTEGTEVK